MQAMNEDKQREKAMKKMKKIKKQEEKFEKMKKKIDAKACLLEPLTLHYIVH